MNVEDYVRYKYENIVYIGKIKFISETMGFDETLQFDIDNCMEEILKQDIIKTSPQIIDLIEVGDYVNGKKVQCFRKENCDYDIGFQYNDDWGEWYGIDFDEIKNVITHEQMEAMQYRVEE